MDCAPPLDYKEPERPLAPVPLNKATAQGTDLSIIIAIGGPDCYFLSSLNDLWFHGFPCFLCLAFFTVFLFLRPLFRGVPRVCFYMRAA